MRLAHAVGGLALAMLASCGEDSGSTASNTAGGAGGADAGADAGAGGSGSGAGGTAGVAGSGGVAGGGNGGSAGVGGASGAANPGCDATGIDPTFSEGQQLITRPFRGVTVIHRATGEPRPLSYLVARIDPHEDGISFRVTPQNGGDPRETTRQTTRAFLEEQGARLAINAHFYSPFPPVDDYAEVRGLAVSDGDAYSPFEGTSTIGFNLDPSNEPALVQQLAGDTTGFASDPAVTLHNAVGGAEQIVTGGVNTATWNEQHPRSAIGMTSTGEVILFVVDGRQDFVSEGLTTPEVADILIADFDVVDALNLDGGGSTSLAVADPIARLANTTVGGAERVVGSSLAVFADLCRANAGAAGTLIAYEGFEYGRRPWGTDGESWPAPGGLVHLMGGQGWGSAWHDDFGASRLNGVAVYPADAGQAEDTRTDPLSYTDASGAMLASAGAQARTSYGTSSSSHRYIDLSKVDSELIATDGKLGADGSTLWISFLAQSYNGSGGDRWAWIGLGDDLRLGKIVDASGNWGIEDVGAGQTRVGDVSSATVVFYVARVEFGAAGEQVSVWFDLALGAAPGTPDISVGVTDFTFAHVTLAGRYSTDFDELRLGSTFDSVAPIAP